MKLTYWTCPMIGKRNPMISITKICEHFKVTEDDIKSSNRSSRYNDPRTILCYVLREHCSWRLQRIANYINRDHSTVLYHHRTVKGLMGVSKSYKDLVTSFL